MVRLENPRCPSELRVTKGARTPRPRVVFEEWRLEHADEASALLGSLFLESAWSPACSRTTLFNHGVHPRFSKLSATA